MLVAPGTRQAMPTTTEGSLNKLLANSGGGSTSPTELMSVDALAEASKEESFVMSILAMLALVDRFGSIVRWVAFRKVVAIVLSVERKSIVKSIKREMIFVEWVWRYNLFPKFCLG